MRKLVRSVLAAGIIGVAALAGVHQAKAEGEGPAIAHLKWSWQGIFGKYDKAQLRRGWQVYRQVCSNCHSMNLMYYRNLEMLGYTKAQVKAFAAEKQVTDGPNDQGNMFQRPAKPSDHFAAPFPNEQAARAAFGGALPPDLSVITKARKGGADYVHAILTGFLDTPPKGFDLPEGKFYNKAFPGHRISMPPPLTDDAVTYTDGTKATLDQEARDVSAYLEWAGNMHLDERHALGLKVMIFLFVFTALLYAVKRKVWSRLH